MRIILFLLFASFFSQPILSQVPTKKEMQGQMLEAINELNKQIAELEKQIAEAKKNKEDDSVIKELEDQVVMLKKQADMMGGLNKNISKLPGATTPKASPFENPDGNSRFPARKKALLESLPKRIISKQELITFLTAVNTELKKKLPVEKVKSAESIIAKMNGEMSTLALAGTMAWYSNAPSDALLILTYAASKSPDDNTLNNCAAIFNLCGLEDKAIPVLKYVLAREPDNSTVLNNLGQAYAGLGELDTAMHYLMACRVVNPSHPEACATSAYLEAERGNTAEAVKLMTEAVKTGYTDARVKFLEDNSPNRSAPYFGLGDIDLKNHFYMRGDFNLPPNCRNWKNCESVYEERQAFLKMIDDMIAHYTAIVQQNSLVTITARTCPWNEAIYFKMNQISTDYMDRRFADFDRVLKQIQQITDDATQEIKAIDAKYEPEYKACVGATSDCATKVEFRYCQEKTSQEDRYHNALADVAENFQHNWYPQDLEYHNKIVWLMSLRSTDARFLKAESATQTIGLLHKLSAYALSICNPAGKPNCEQYNPANNPNVNSAAYINANCPINIIIPAGPLKMNLNCGQFKVDISAGVAITYEKDFITKETTIAVGAGASLGPKVVEIGAKAQAYVKFDANNQPVDLGVLGEVELEIVGPISPTVKAGFTAGVNSGINPTGQLKSFVGLSTYSW